MRYKVNWVEEDYLKNEFYAKDGRHTVIGINIKGDKQAVDTFLADIEKIEEEYRAFCHAIARKTLNSEDDIAGIGISFPTIAEATWFWADSAGMETKYNVKIQNGFWHTRGDNNVS